MAPTKLIRSLYPFMGLILESVSPILWADAKWFHLTLGVKVFWGGGHPFGLQRTLRKYYFYEGGGYLRELDVMNPLTAASFHDCENVHC